MTIECSLVLTKFLSALCKFSSCLLKIFLELQSNLLFQIFLQKVDVVLYKSKLAICMVKFVNQLISPSENSCVHNPIQFIFGLLKFVFKIKQLLVLVINHVLVVDYLKTEILASSTHFNLSVFHNTS